MALRAQLSILLMLVWPAAAFANSDVVIFDNGDRLTGEIKSLERGKLRFKTDATDTISIEWDDVAFLSSEQNIQVELYDGKRYLGKLIITPAMKTINVQFGGEYEELDSSLVVVMTPIEERALDRLDVAVTAGYNFTKADSVEQFNFGLDAEYRTEKRSFGLAVNSSISNTSDKDVSQRNAMNINYRRFWPNRWLVSGFVNATRNDELGVDLRTSAGGGGGRIITQSNHNRLLLESGLMYSREDLASDDNTDQPSIQPVPPIDDGGKQSDQKSIEAYVSMDWDVYRFDSPELDLSTSIQIIPSLTESGRVRGEFDIALKWEIIHDLFWEISLYNSYDSNPGTEGASQNDYGITTSLGYDF
ncbi:MAG: DUF481 domain-containing protein [Woeseiaceae bacterium]